MESDYEILTMLVLTFGFLIIPSLTLLFGGILILYMLRSNA